MYTKKMFFLYTKNVYNSSKVICLQKKYEERFVGSQDSSRLLKRSHVDDSGEKKSVKSKTGPNGMNIRSMTFYKADTEEDDDGEQNGEFA